MAQPQSLTNPFALFTHLFNFLSNQLNKSFNEEVADLCGDFRQVHTEIDAIGDEIKTDVRGVLGELADTVGEMMVLVRERMRERQRQRMRESGGVEGWGQREWGNGFGQYEKEKADGGEEVEEVEEVEEKEEKEGQTGGHRAGLQGSSGGRVRIVIE